MTRWRWTVRPYAVRAPEKRALRDPLTGLADRVLVEDRVDHAIERLWRRHACLAVLFIDIDRFHVINDSLGHATGDILLCEVANRLKSVAPPGRHGGPTRWRHVRGALRRSSQPARRRSDRTAFPSTTSGARSVSTGAKWP